MGSQLDDVKELLMKHDLFTPTLMGEACYKFGPNFLMVTKQHQAPVMTKYDVYESDGHYFIRTADKIFDTRFPSSFLQLVQTKGRVVFKILKTDTRDVIVELSSQ